MKHSLKKSTNILMCLKKGTSIAMMCRYKTYTEKQVKDVLKENYYPHNLEYSKLWADIEAFRKTLSFPIPELRKFTNKEIETVFLKRLEGQTYQAISTETGIGIGYVGNLCSCRTPRSLTKKLKNLWEQIQEKRDDLDNRK